MLKVDIKYGSKKSADKGFQEVQARLMNFKKNLPDEFSKALLSFGIKAQSTSKKSYLSGPRPKKLDVVTGRLRSSIRLHFEKENNIAKVSIGTPVKYGILWEIGGKTRGKKKLAARPFLAPAVKDNIMELKKNLSKLGAAYGK